MAKREVINHLCSRYSVRPDEARKATALATVSRDMIDVLETERVNYEEFFARSRQLVTGTCVGIGQKHLGIAENQYDWVIIDEAARSIASELAIAMQSGKRVLLVGDHKQLPPLYSDAHKRALALKLGIADKDVDLDAILQSDFARGFESPYGIQAGASLLTQYRMALRLVILFLQLSITASLKMGLVQSPIFITMFQQHYRVLLLGLIPLSWGRNAITAKIKVSVSTIVLKPISSSNY